MGKRKRDMTETAVMPNNLMILQEWQSVLNSHNIIHWERGISRMEQQLSKGGEEAEQIFYSYMLQSPDCLELFGILENTMNKQLDGLDIPLTKLWQHIVRLCSVSFLKSHGLTIIRKMVREYMKWILKGLKSDRILLMSETLLLLTKMSQFHASCALEIYQNFPLDIKLMQRLACLKRHEDDEGKISKDIQSLFAEFVFGLLGCLEDVQTKQEILTINDWTWPILKSLPSKDLDTIQFIINILKQKVLSEHTLSKSIKIRYFNNFVLEKLLKVYEISSEDLSKVQLVKKNLHAFMMDLCTKPGKGICFRDLGWYSKPVDAKTKGIYFNKVLLEFLSKLMISKNLLQQDLLLQILRACPELIQPFWRRHFIYFEPKFSLKCLSSMALALKIILFPLPKLLDYPPNVTIAIDHICPSSFGRNFFILGLQNSNPLVQQFTLNLLNAMLEKFCQLNDIVGTISKGKENDTWSTFLCSLKDEFRKHVPDLQNLFFLRYHLASRMFTVPTEDKNELYSRVLQSLYLINANFPDLITETRYDFTKLIPIPSNWVVLSPSSIYYTLLLLENRISTKQFLSKCQSSNVSCSFALLSLLQTTSISKILALTYKIIYHILIDSLLFCGHEYEIAIWLRSLRKNRNYLVLFNECLSDIMQSSLLVIDQHFSITNTLENEQFKKIVGLESPFSPFFLGIWASLGTQDKPTKVPGFMLLQNVVKKILRIFPKELVISHTKKCGNKFPQSQILIDLMESKNSRKTYPDSSSTAIFSFFTKQLTRLNRKIVLDTREYFIFQEDQAILKLCAIAALKFYQLNHSIIEVSAMLLFLESLCMFFIYVASQIDDSGLDQYLPNPELFFNSQLKPEELVRLCYLVTELALRIPSFKLKYFVSGRFFKVSSSMNSLQALELGLLCSNIVERYESKYINSSIEKIFHSSREIISVNSVNKSIKAFVNIVFSQTIDENTDQKILDLLIQQLLVAPKHPNILEMFKCLMSRSIMKEYQFRFSKESFKKLIKNASHSENSWELMILYSFTDCYMLRFINSIKSFSCDRVKLLTFLSTFEQNDVSYKDMISIVRSIGSLPESKIVSTLAILLAWPNAEDFKDEIELFELIFESCQTIKNPQIFRVFLWIFIKFHTKLGKKGSVLFAGLLRSAISNNIDINNLKNDVYYVCDLIEWFPESISELIEILSTSVQSTSFFCIINVAVKILKKSPYLNKAHLLQPFFSILTNYVDVLDNFLSKSEGIEFLKIILWSENGFLLNKALLNNILMKMMLKYNASFSAYDQSLISFINQLERRGYSVLDTVISCWRAKSVGDARAFASFPNESEQVYYQRIASIVADLLNSIDTNRMQRTIEQFPVHAYLEPMAENSAQQEDLYDPAFILPLLNFFFSQNVEIDLRRLIELDYLGFVVLALSSDDDYIRLIAHRLLNTADQMINYGNFREGTQIQTFLHFFRNGISIRSKFPDRIPTIITQFIAKSLRILLRPSDTMYPLINAFMLQRPQIDISDVPMFYSLMLSGSTRHRSERNWFLSILSHSLLDEPDYIILCRRHVFELLLNFFDSTGSDFQAQHLVIKCFKQLAQSFTSAKDLLTNRGIIPWASARIHEFMSENRACANELAEVIVRACESILQYEHADLSSSVRCELLVMINSLASSLINIIEINPLLKINLAVCLASLARIVLERQSSVEFSSHVCLNILKKLNELWLQAFHQTPAHGGEFDSLNSPSVLKSNVHDLRKTMAYDLCTLCFSISPTSRSFVRMNFHAHLMIVYPLLLDVLSYLQDPLEALRSSELEYLSLSPVDGMEYFSFSIKKNCLLVQCLRWIHSFIEQILTCRHVENTEVPLTSDTLDLLRTILSCIGFQAQLFPHRAINRTDLSSDFHSLLVRWFNIATFSLMLYYHWWESHLFPNQVLETVLGYLSIYPLPSSIAFDPFLPAADSNYYFLQSLRTNSTESELSDWKLFQRYHYRPLHILLSHFLVARNTLDACPVIHTL